MPRIRRSFVAAVLTTFALGAVALAQESAPPFDKNALQRYLARGGAGLSGALVVAVPGGDKPIAAAHARVILVPDSAYTRWWFARTNADLAGQSGAFQDPPDDANLRPFLKSTLTDDDGNFRFDGLPPGSYRVRGRVDATFDRTTATPHEVKSVGLDGSSVVTTEFTTTTVHDHSAFWLESGLVRLGPGDHRAIALHVAVRRNTYGRR